MTTKNKRKEILKLLWKKIVTIDAKNSKLYLQTKTELEYLDQINVNIDWINIILISNDKCSKKREGKDERSFLKRK